MMRSPVLSRTTTALFALFGLLACAPPVVETPPGVMLSDEEYARVMDAADRVDGLTRQVASLEERLVHAEQRVGLAAVPTERLTPLSEVSEARLTGPVSFVSGPGARARRMSLSDHVRTSGGAVITFWATWCVPCTSDEELAHLRELQGYLRRHDIPLVSIAVDELATVQAHPKSRAWLYPFWHRMDAHIEMLPRSFVMTHGIGLPLFLVIGGDGEIRYFYNRQLDAAAVRDLVSAAAAL